MRGKLKWLGLVTAIVELLKMIVGLAKSKKDTEKIEPPKEG